MLKHGQSERSLESKGSGFFIRYFGKVLFVTASHVTDELKLGNLYIPTVEGRIDSLGGQFFHTRASASAPGIDRVDLAFIELPDELAKLLPADNVYTVSDWDDKNMAGPNSHYLLCGWPAKRNQPNYRNHKQLPHAPISYRDLCLPSSQYQALGISPQTHYALHFDQKRALDGDGRRIQPPQLYGVSGGPLFFFHRYRSAMDGLTIPMPKLVGVAIEWRRPEQAVIATRISLLLALLNRHFRGPDDPSNPDTVSFRPGGARQKLSLLPIL